MAKFNVLKWFNKGDPEATEDNSVLNEKTLNNLEKRIDDAINGVFFDNAGSHNAIFRGKDVTNYLDDGTLWDKISSGTFEDLYIGDYFLKDNIKWRIAGFDYFLNVGNTKVLKHHIAIVPDENLTTAKMNPTNDTTGGYANSDMVNNVLPTVLTTIENVFGSSHILEYNLTLTNTVDTTRYNRYGRNTGASSGWTWANRKVDLMNEVQVAGTLIWGSSGFEVGTCYSQFPLFRLAPEYISTRNIYRLRDVVDKNCFCVVANVGNISGGYSAGENLGVRPFFFIGTN